MASKTASIHFSNLKQKVENGFSLCGDGFFNSLLLSVFSTTILLGLGIDKMAKAITEQADQDRLRDQHISIKFLEYGL